MDALTNNITSYANNLFSISNNSDITASFSGISQREHLSLITNSLKAYEGQYGYDLTCNGNLQTLEFERVYRNFDPEMLCSMKRTGDDFVNSHGKGELKSSKLASPYSLGKAGFHTFAVEKNGIENQYVFFNHFKRSTCNFYHFATESYRTAIYNEIKGKADIWKDQVFTGVKNGKHDMISISETFCANLSKDLPVWKIELNTGEITMTEKSSPRLVKGEEYNSDVVYFVSDTKPE